MLDRGDLQGQSAGQAHDPCLGRAIGPAAGNADEGGRRGDADDGATLAPLHHARHGLGGAEEEAGEMRPDDGLPFLEGKLADQPDPLDAGIVDQDVGRLAFAVDGGEGGLDAPGVGDIGLEIAHARAAPPPARSCPGRRRAAPAARIAWTMASPIPRAPPVTTAVRPLKLLGSMFLLAFLVIPAKAGIQGRLAKYCAVAPGFRLSPE